MGQDLRDYLRILRKHRALVLVAFVGCVIAAIVMTTIATPQYEAEGKLFVGQRQVAPADLQDIRNLTELSLQLIQSYAAIVKTHPIAEAAVKSGKLPQDPVKLTKDLHADPILNTQLIRLTYRSYDPELARDTINAVAQTFVHQIETIEAPVEGGTPSKPVVRVSVVEPPLIPTDPVSPNIPFNIGLSVILGLVLGLGCAFLAEYLDTTIKDKLEAEATLEVPVLASVPRIRTRKFEIYLEGDNQSQMAETFRKLTAAIHLYAIDEPLQVIVVTSPFAQEGKTTTAVNLAAANAYAGIATLLVEADLRRPRLHSLFRPQGINGLTLSMVDDLPIGQAVVDTHIPNLSCLPAGAVPPNPVQVLSSRQFTEALNELRGDFKSIIIDAPPILPVADTTHIVGQADGVLLVVRAKETRRDRAVEAADQVRKAGGNLLGVVLNAVPEGKSGSDYYSYYASQR